MVRAQEKYTIGKALISGTSAYNYGQLSSSGTSSADAELTSAWVNGRIKTSGRADISGRLAINNAISSNIFGRTRLRTGRIRLAIDLSAEGIAGEALSGESEVNDTWATMTISSSGTSAAQATLGVEMFLRTRWIRGTSTVRFPHVKDAVDFGAVRGRSISFSKDRLSGVTLDSPGYIDSATIDSQWAGIPITTKEKEYFSQLVGTPQGSSVPEALLQVDFIDSNMVLSKVSIAEDAEGTSIGEAYSYADHNSAHGWLAGTAPYPELETDGESLIVGANRILAEQIVWVPGTVEGKAVILEANEPIVENVAFEVSGYTGFAYEIAAVEEHITQFPALRGIINRSINPVTELSEKNGAKVTGTDSLGVPSGEVGMFISLGGALGPTPSVDASLPVIVGEAEVSVNPQLFSSQVTTTRYAGGYVSIPIGDPYPSSPSQGDYVYDEDLDKYFIWNGSEWQETNNPEGVYRDAEEDVGGIYR